MFSKRTEPRSITSQLVLLFTPAAALLLLCGLGVFYWIVVRHAFEEDNVVLADKVDALQTDFEKHGGVDALTPDINAVGFSRAAFLVRVLDPAGAAIGQTPGMETLLPPSTFPSAASREIAVPIEHRSGGKLFALTTRHALGNGQLFTIQVAQDRSGDEQFAKEFGVLVLIVLAVGSIAAAALAVTVTRHGLRPLAELAAALQRIGPRRLHERVPPARWPRELRPVAVAFDDMLDRLEDSFTRLSQFSADLAHELRTPIANILGEAQVALTRARQPDEYREVIVSTVAECERLSGIVDNLLFLARAEAADRQIQPSLFDGRATIAKIAAYYEALADDRHLAISCAGEGEIYADPILFGRALSNLIDNALRFTPDGGSIRIAISMHATHAEVSVADTGCGIAAEHISRVFDRFFRVDPSRSTHGAGLGLALVKSIVDLHGGSAIVQSEPGRGTTVTITFPKQANRESKP
jgi:two-component system heavy metal sensor histidine kinase CusS